MWSESLSCTAVVETRNLPVLQIQGDTVQNLLAVQKLELPRYLTLYSPALDWILQCLAHHASESVLVNVLEKARTKCNR